MSKYIDFYGYNKMIYEKLTKDFVDCINLLDPKIAEKAPEYREWGRCERKILVNELEIDETSIDKCMLGKNYVRYQDYNFYMH